MFIAASYPTHTNELPALGPDATERFSFGRLRARVGRSVGEALASDADGDAAEALLPDMHEQLDGPEFDDELAELPIDVVIASICRALGGELHLKHFADAELELTPGQSERRSLHSGPTGSTLPNN